MDFNILVLERIVPLFSREGIFIKKMEDNLFYFESDLVEVSLSFNILDRSTGFAIGPKGRLRTVTEYAINKVFNIGIQLTNVTKEVFVNNLFFFFSNEGLTLLRGNLDKLRELDEQVGIESKSYTDNIINLQNLKEIDDAWDEQNYFKFINLMGKFYCPSFPASYMLKLKIAHKKLGETD